MSYAATTTKAPDSSTDANFRAWAQAIHDAFTNMGLVNTTDTGQINLATVAKPAAINTFQGYEIWRFADALQGTFPVYFKIEYGSGSGRADSPALRFTIGSGSNGSGTITGQVTSAISIASQGNSQDTTLRNCVFSGDTNRFCFSIFTNASNTQHQLTVSLERRCDNSGNDQSTGVLFMGTTSGDSSARSGWKIQYIPSTGAVPSTATAGPLSLALVAASSTGNYGTDTAVYPQYVNNNGELCQSRNFVTYFNGDIVADSQASFNLFGSSHNFYFLGKCTNIDAYNSNNTRLAIRFE